MGNCSASKSVIRKSPSMGASSSIGTSRSRQLELVAKLSSEPETIVSGVASDPGVVSFSSRQQLEAENAELRMRAIALSVGIRRSAR